MLNPDIQHFAEAPAEGTDAGNGGNDAQGGGNSSKTFTQADVDKIVNERTDRAAKAALRSFYQQKGLSEEEAAQAIDSYLAEKKKNSPESVNAELKSQLDAANADLLRERLTRAAEKAARSLGADEKSIDYIVKLTDTSLAVENGEIKADKLAEAVRKVLDDVPAFKKQAESSGVKIGGDNSEQRGSDRGQSGYQTAKKPWNRFNHN